MTTWKPVDPIAGQWLLSDGQVISSPALEESATGRNVRVVGTTTSVHRNRIHELIFESVTHRAKAAGQKVLGFVTPVDISPNPNLDFLTPPKDVYTHQTARFTWEFRHEEWPVQAVISIDVGVYRDQVNITTQISANRLNAIYPNENYRRQNLAIFNKSNNSELWDGITDYYTSENNLLAEMMRDNPPPFVEEIGAFLRNSRWSSRREAATHLLKAMRVFDETLEVQIPVVLSSTEIEWLTLPFYDSSVTESILSDLVDYLDSAASIKDVIESWENLRIALQRIGFQIGPKSEDDFAAMLSTPGDSAFTYLANGWDPNGEHAYSPHQIYVHLLSGSVVVSCPNHDMHSGAQEKWEEALTIASLTGTDKDLLEFAREYTFKNTEQKARDYINDRRIAL